MEQKRKMFSASSGKNAEGDPHIARKREELLMCLESYFEALEGSVTADQEISKPSSSKGRAPVYIYKDLKEKIEALAKDRDLTESEVVGSLLEQALQQNEKDEESADEDVVDA